MLKTTAYSLLILSSCALHGMEQETQPIVKLFDILNTPYKDVKTLPAGTTIEVDATTRETFGNMKALGNNSQGNIIFLLNDVFTLEKDSTLDKNYKTSILNHIDRFGVTVSYDNDTSHFAHHLILQKLFKLPFPIVKSYLAKTYSLSIIYPSTDLDKNTPKGFSLSEGTDYVEVDNPAYQTYKEHIITSTTPNNNADITNLLLYQRH